VVVKALGPAADDLYLETLEDQARVLEEEVTASLGPEGVTVLNQDGNSMLSAMSAQMTLNARYVSSVLESAITYLDGIGGSNPATSIVQVTEYSTTLSGRLLRSVARAVERVGDAAAAPQVQPSQFIRTFRSGCDSIRRAVASAIVKNQILINAAAFLAVKLAAMFEDDDRAMSRIKQLETAIPFDDDGTYRAPDPVPMAYTADELERTVALAREMIQEALVENRGLLSLRIIADKLVAHVNTVKLERERMVEIEVSEVLPLHALLLRRGIPAAAAERIAVINDFWCPNFITGKVRVYA